MPKDLSKLLSPSSVAVIGASRTPNKVGAIVLENIKNSGFTGKIYPVNPNAQNIDNLKCYPDVNSLPETPDLAIVAIPAIKVAEVLNQINEKGIKNVVIFSAGFKEIGEIGEKLEKELSDIASTHSLNILGPNCLGYVNNKLPINATFGKSENTHGNLRFISQSGAIAASLFDWCQSTDLGFSEFVTLGNKTVINENDVLKYFKENEINYENAENEGLSSVNPIGMYLESITAGSKFVKLTSEIGTTNPVFIIKPGKSKAAKRAMQSHTGAIAGEDDVFSAALKQSGIARCETLDDFFDIARAFSWENAPTGNKIAVVSNAGGPAVISADAASKAGLELTSFSEETKNKLLQVLPRTASVLNPVDVLGDALADRYQAACEIVLETDQVDALVIILTPQMMTQVERTAEIVGELSKKYKRPIFCSFIGGSLVAEGEKILNRARIPSFRFPERAISAIGAMHKWKKRQQEIAEEGKIQESQAENLPENAKTIIDRVVAEKKPSLDALEANEIITSLGIPTPPTAAVSNLEEAKKFAVDNNWPVVLKLTSPGLLHKAKLGGVVTNIWNEDHLETAWNRLSHKASELGEMARKDLRFQIQKEVASGVEAIVGVKHDPVFGPILLFGVGGELAELVGDKNIKVLPIDKDRLQDLITNSKVYKLLKTAPGEPAYAIDKLYDLIEKISSALPMIPQVSDIEINPVIITYNDVWAVDAKIVLAQAEAEIPSEAVAKAPQFHTATLKNAVVLASKFRYFEFVSEKPLNYKPGQYISVKVAPNRINSYSLAGGSGNPEFSLLVDTSPGGPGSKFFENIKPGDKIAYLGPFGTFTFNEGDGANKILFLGTGSGCSPLRSILESALNNPNIKVPVHFYFGLRYSDDIFWKDYFEKLAQEHPNFHFNLVLSKPDEGWSGQSGHITDILKNEITNAGDASAYLCGNPKMIEEASAILKSINCPEERIYKEHF